jgi:D-alanyl-D-alanine carboxypeptidase/D-alanyl-D-alanine-endopeptidase (penicillin-binding protein 4)
MGLPQLLNAFVLAFALALSYQPAFAADRSLGAEVPKPAASGAAWSADSVTRLGADIDASLSDAPTLRGAHVGLLVLETRSGRVLYARNADDAFQPASTLKLLTGSVALANLTPGFRFRTEALLDRAAATLYIRGGGDPLLNVGDLQAMAQAVRASGVSILASGLRVDASAFEPDPYPPGWSWDDLVYDYAPALSAASIEENVVHLTVIPGPAVGAPVMVRGAPPPFERVAAEPAANKPITNGSVPNEPIINGSVANEPLAPAGTVPAEGCPYTFAIVVRVRATTAASGTENSLDVRREPGGCIEVTGLTALGSAPQSIDAAVPSPIWYLHILAQHALAQAGVAGVDVVSRLAATARLDDAIGTVPAGSRAVWTHDGEPLSDLLADLWWPSDNLIAELLLKEIGLRDSGMPGTTEHGADAERAWLLRIGIDPATVTIADGSGLSTYDRITPRALAAILQTDWNGPYREMVLDDLPIAGVRGTLEKSFAGSLAERRTFAKTGSVNHTRGLAGYLATLHHGAVTFAWSLDDWQGTDSDLNILRARVLSRLIGD